MWGASFYEKASRLFQQHPSLTKLLLVTTISGGGLVAFNEGRPFYSRTAYADAAQPEGELTKKKKVVVLGTGWAGVSFLKNLKSSNYDVEVVSPHNYFLFTPLLPSITCGTVEARSIVEPIRCITKKRGLDVQFREAACYKIDPQEKKVYCRTTQDNNLCGKSEFSVDYDYLIIAMGAKANTFNTPGVEEHAHFLKGVEDALKIRQSVINCFERASLPCISKEERRKLLHFVVVGGGPAGVEFAAELHDFLVEDLAKLYPSVKDDVTITLMEAMDHILSMFDTRITQFAEEKFSRDGIQLKTGCQVVKLTDKEISTKERTTGEVTSTPYGMCLWATGIGPRTEIIEFMKQIGQANSRVLATDEWLRVEGCDGVFALGDCATINQRRVMDDISHIFSKGDVDKSGILSLATFHGVIDDVMERYPQVKLHLKSKQMKSIQELLKDITKKNSSTEIDIETFKSALSQADTQMKNLPATAQVAAQQGEYLADCFNRMEECERNPEGPLMFRDEGRHHFHPFRYKHMGMFAPLGGKQTAAHFPGDRIFIGYSMQWLWYSVYVSKLVSWRTRVLVISDWGRRFIFGRDSSRIREHMESIY